MPSPAMPDSASESSLVVHRLDSMDQRLDGMDQRLDSMDQRLDSMDQRLDSMDQRLDRVDGRLDRVEATLGGLCVSAGKTDTKINIVLGMLGAIGSGASFLLIRLLLN